STLKATSGPATSSAKPISTLPLDRDGAPIPTSAIRTYTTEVAEATRPGSLEGPVSSERPNERHGLNIRRDVAITTAAQVGVAIEVAAGYFRGLFDFKTSAVLRVVGVAAVPVVLLVVLPQKSIATLILLMALALIALSVLAIALPLARAFIATSRAALAGAAGTLLNYGT